MSAETARRSGFVRVIRAVLLALVFAFVVGFLVGTLIRRELERPVRYIGRASGGAEPSIAAAGLRRLATDPRDQNDRREGDDGPEIRGTDESGLHCWSFEG